MIKVFIAALLIGTTVSTTAQDLQFITADVDNFWHAYDRINATSDSLQRRKILKEQYLDKGTAGLQSLLQVRNYTEDEYLNMIAGYPRFWKSLRGNTLNVKREFPAIEEDLSKLRRLYPSLKPATIYFSMGAFRTNGTIHQDRVLIGCELALADEFTIIDEHPDFRQGFYRNSKPRQNLALLCTHEYVHTQQLAPANSLLANCLYEGAAEFISCLATGKKSYVPAMDFGAANHLRVFAKFEQDIFFNRRGDWLWGENLNELKERDLGYYVGYKICERFYEQSTDKQEAIRQLIELNYGNQEEVERFADATKLFTASVSEMRKAYDKKRPTVTGVTPLTNDAKIKGGVIELAINFSEEMDTNFRGFDYGPLGEDHVYKFRKLIGWSNNNRTLTLEVEVAPNRKYQTYITSTFRNKEGIRLVPFLIQFETEK